jgi:hypothetical protein
MSHADNCYDNAVAENGFGPLMTELDMIGYDHVPAARHEIGDCLTSPTATSNVNTAYLTTSHPIRSNSTRPVTRSQENKELDRPSNRQHVSCYHSHQLTIIAP